jgi:NAD(P)-dependent dehydrogenase (short-subunit alcohol dehydrogenase family)
MSRPTQHQVLTKSAIIDTPPASRTSRCADAFGRSVQDRQRKVADYMDLIGQLAVEIVIVIERHQLAALQNIEPRIRIEEEGRLVGRRSPAHDDSQPAVPKLQHFLSNAGRQQAHDSILDISTEDFDATMKTNIYAPFWIIKAALPHLKPGLAIIGTTSEQAYNPTPDLYDYAQTKAATMNYVKSLAKQLGPKGIRVNGVAPGPVWTPLQVSGGASQEKLQKFGSQTVFGRPGQPAELASVYVQLAAADASFATGQVYGSSGGNGQP